MTPAEWEAIAARCEKATGLDYHDHYTLTDAILAGCGFDGGFVGDDGSDEWQRHDSNGDSHFSGMVTQSLDAITSLIVSEVPKSWPVFTIQGDDRYDPEPRRCWHKREITVPSSGFRGEAPTPALALCAAFCRAKAQEVTDDNA